MRAASRSRFAGYDLCPDVTIGQIINQIRTACLFLWRRFGQRLMVYGHSAGGHSCRLHGGDRLEEA